MSVAAKALGTLERNCKTLRDPNDVGNVGSPGWMVYTTAGGQRKATQPRYNKKRGKAVSNWARFGGLAIALLLGACSEESSVEIETTAADVQWPMYARDRGETRFSPLTQINVGNVEQLGLAWALELGTVRSMEATPIVVDDVMYFPGAWNVIYAIDAGTGDVLWRYDPKVDRNFTLRILDTISRGVAVSEGKVYAATLDGRLLAIDAQDGELIWQTLTIDLDEPYFITGAPRVVKDHVIIGNGGAENGVRGYFSAYPFWSPGIAW